MTTKMREEFERWWRSKTPTRSETVFGAIAWEAWQASARVEREACKKRKMGIRR